jgi:hypothetical protein
MPPSPFCPRYEMGIGNSFEKIGCASISMGDGVLPSTRPLRESGTYITIAYPSPPKRGFTKSWHSTSSPHLALELSLLSSLSRTSLLQKALCSIEILKTLPRWRNQDYVCFLPHSLLPNIADQFCLASKPRIIVRSSGLF